MSDPVQKFEQAQNDLITLFHLYINSSRYHFHLKKYHTNIPSLKQLEQNQQILNYEYILKLIEKLITKLIESEGLEKINLIRVGTDQDPLILYALKNRCEKLFHILMNHGANLTLQDSQGYNALHYLAADGYHKTLADIKNKITASQWSEMLQTEASTAPLYTAPLIAPSITPIICALHHSINPQPNTPLSENKHILPTLKVLLPDDKSEAQMLFNTFNTLGRTVLFEVLALGRGSKNSDYSQILKLFLDCQPDVKFFDVQGQGPIHLAAILPDPYHLYNLITQHEADPKTNGSNFVFSPILLSLKHKYPVNTAILLAYGAEIPTDHSAYFNLQTDYGPCSISISKTHYSYKIKGYSGKLISGKLPFTEQNKPHEKNLSKTAKKELTLLINQALTEDAIVYAKQALRTTSLLTKEIKNKLIEKFNFRLKLLETPSTAPSPQMIYLPQQLKGKW